MYSDSVITFLQDTTGKERFSLYLITKSKAIKDIVFVDNLKMFPQITVADINKDQTLELIALDTSGNVICLNEDGTVYWELATSGDNSPGSRLVDVDGDGYVEIIVPTNEG